MSFDMCTFQCVFPFLYAQSSMTTFSSWSEKKKTKKKQVHDTNVDMKSVLKLINNHLLDPTFVQLTTLENKGK